LGLSYTESTLDSGSGLQSFGLCYSSRRGVLFLLLLLYAWSRFLFMAGTARALARELASHMYCLQKGEAVGSAEPWQSYTCAWDVTLWDGWDGKLDSGIAARPVHARPKHLVEGTS
jgi:hypothetical protein